MRENLDSVSRHSLILRFFRNLFIIGIAAAATFTAALPLMAADTFTQAVEGYFYYNINDLTDEKPPLYFGPGDTIEDGGIFGGSALNDPRRFGYVALTDIQAGCTYTITFQMSYTNPPLLYKFDEISFLGLTFSKSLPGWVDMLPQYNSASVDYSVFCDWDYSSNESAYVDYITFAFCTAEGYIDNLDWGEFYATFDFLGVLDTMGDPVIDAIYVDCVVDPSAEYFHNLSLNNFKNFNNDLKNKLDILADKEIEIIGMGREYYNQSRDLLTSSIDATKSFLSPTARSSGSIAPALAVFSLGIFDPLISSLPPELAVLFTVIPTLAFAAWFLGFGKGF